MCIKQIWVCFWVTEAYSLTSQRSIIEPYTLEQIQWHHCQTQNHHSDVTVFKSLTMRLMHQFFFKSEYIHQHCKLTVLKSLKNLCKNISLLRYTFLVKFLSGKIILLVLILKYYLVNFQRSKYKNFSIPRQILSSLLCPLIPRLGSPVLLWTLHSSVFQNYKNNLWLFKLKQHMKIKIIMSKLTIFECCSFKILAVNCSIRMSHI